MTAALGAGGESSLAEPHASPRYLGAYYPIVTANHITMASCRFPYPFTRALKRLAAINAFRIRTTRFAAWQCLSISGVNVQGNQ